MAKINQIDMLVKLFEYDMEDADLQKKAFAKSFLESPVYALDWAQRAFDTQALGHQSHSAVNMINVLRGKGKSDADVIEALIEEYAERAMYTGTSGGDLPSQTLRESQRRAAKRVWERLVSAKISLKKAA